MRWNRLSSAEYLAADRLVLERLLAIGKSDTYQREFIAKDGTLIPFLIRRHRSAFAKRQPEFQ